MIQKAYDRQQTADDELARLCDSASCQFRRSRLSSGYQLGEARKVLLDKPVVCLPIDLDGVRFGDREKSRLNRLNHEPDGIEQSKARVASDGLFPGAMSSMASGSPRFNAAAMDAHSPSPSRRALARRRR